MDPFQIYFVSLAHLSIIRTGNPPPQGVRLRTPIVPLYRGSPGCATSQSMVRVCGGCTSASSSFRCGGAVDRLRVSPSHAILRAPTYMRRTARAVLRATNPKRSLFAFLCGARWSALHAAQSCCDRSLRSPQRCCASCASRTAPRRVWLTPPFLPCTVAAGGPWLVRRYCVSCASRCRLPWTRPVQRSGAGRERHRTRADVRRAHAAHAPAADVPGGRTPECVAIAIAIAIPFYSALGPHRAARRVRCMRDSARGVRIGWARVGISRRRCTSSPMGSPSISPTCSTPRSACRCPS